MKKKFILSLSLVCFIAPASYSQATKSRSLLQQNFITGAFIMPQLEKSPLTITGTSQIDSLFTAFQEGWKKVSKDSLQEYHSKLTLHEFNNIDAYCYFWALASITQNLNIISAYGDYLVKNYMAPAMQRDYVMLRRLPDTGLIKTIHGGNLGNTLAIGSGKGISRKTFFETFDVYGNFHALFDSLSKSTDTALAEAAVKQLHDLDNFYYPLYARYSFYKGQTDKAFTLLVSGLNVDKYSKSRAIDLARDLVIEFNSEGATDKSFAVLNTLAINTTPDNLNRDTLKSWYSGVDKSKGMAMYESLQQKLSTSAFKYEGKHIDLPRNWDFIVNALSPDKVGKAKYIIADFWFTHCGPCIAEIPELNALYEKIKSRDDIIFIAFNTDYSNGEFTRDVVARQCREMGIKYPVFYDSDSTRLNKQLSVAGYPAKFILTTSGSVISKTDRSDMSLGSLELFLSEALDGSLPGSSKTGH